MDKGERRLGGKEMIRVKEFYTYNSTGIEFQINDFLKNNILIEVVDIKYNVVYNSRYDNFRSSALLIYKEL